jgi:hypothetical protein
MKNLSAILGELFALFVDDGSLALAVLGIVLCVGVLSRVFPGWTQILGEVLIVACAGILVENVLRTSRNS